MSESGRNVALEGLRGVASVNVILGHFLFSFFPYLAHNVRPYPSPIARYAFEKVMMYPPFTFLYLADAAVSVFFVLSGYVLTARFYATGQTRDFESAAIRRYFRLVGPAFVSVMFAWILLVMGAYGNHLAGQLGTAGWLIPFYKEPVSFGGALFRGLIAAPLFGQSEINGPLWTLQIELLGSILLFGCYSLFGARSKLLLGFWFLFFACVVSGRTAGMLHYIALLAGSLIHVVESRLKASRLLSSLCLILGLLGVSVTFAGFFAPLFALRLPDLSPYGPNFGPDPGLFWHTLGALFLVAGVVGSSAAHRILSHRIPAYLGRISFSIYLLHFPLMMALGFRTAQLGQAIGLSYLAYATLAMVITLGVLFVLGESFYKFVDAPSIKLASLISRWMSP